MAFKHSLEAPPLAGHESLTMADQMRAQAIPAQYRTSPIDGSVKNMRRAFMERAIAKRTGAMTEDSVRSQGHSEVDHAAVLDNT